MTVEEIVMGLADDLAPAEYVLMDVADEMDRQDQKWGDQSRLHDGTGGAKFRYLADAYRAHCDRADAAGTLTWLDILTEEFYEALAEHDADKLRAELIQVAAVASQWAAALDKRGAL